MKTGRNGPSLLDYEVKLPQEIIAVVLSYVQASELESIRQYTYWSCCLLSKPWYSAAVQYLYQSPRLSNKNFDKFARTMCPPVNSHVRRIGLESFVHHLDMGHLAYESSKSLTARLLRRAGKSLEIFVAPAVSFSITCLAPLSKCQNLHTLDLSRDFYDIDLSQLLHAVAGLPLLRSLSLPKSAMKKKCPLKSASSGSNSWPLSLSFLQINDWLPEDPAYWAELVESWAPSLVSVAFENCLNWYPFFRLYESRAIAPHVRSLSIGMRREEDGFSLEVLLVAFPALRYLAIPTPVTTPAFVVEVHNLPGKGEDLEYLAFRPAPDSVQPKPKISTELLLTCVYLQPKLIRIEVPESYVEFDDDSPDHLDRIEKLTSIRVNFDGRDTGVFLTEG